MINLAPDQLWVERLKASERTERLFRLRPWRPPHDHPGSPRVAPRANALLRKAWDQRCTSPMIRTIFEKHVYDRSPMDHWVVYGMLMGLLEETLKGRITMADVGPVDIPPPPVPELKLPDKKALKRWDRKWG